ncbi:MAG: zinc ribbon domain-containing protein [Chloroflexi bacterium]|nr:zinc ribbon domain-containing protein [Chloroflexota bacterium]
MPIYEYTCEACEKTFEVLRPMSQADEPIPCAVCGGKHTRRKLSVFFAESGGKAVAGTSGGCDCGACSSHDCSSCGH